jgi:signal transduction histidine kinase
MDVSRRPTAGSSHPDDAGWEHNQCVGRAVRPLVSAFFVAVVVVSVPAMGAVRQPATSYAATSEAMFVATAAAAVALLVAGGFALLHRTSETVGTLSLVVAAAWLAPVWEGWPDGSAPLRSVGMVLSAFSLPALVHLTVAGPGGRLLSAGARWMATAVWVVTAVVAVALSAVRDPLLDGDCWRNCTDNVFLVHAMPGPADALSALRLWIIVVAGVGALAVVGSRLATGAGRGRWEVWSVPVSAAVAGLAEAVHALALLGTPAEDPELPVFRVVFVLRAATIVVLAASVGWAVVRAGRLAVAVSGLAAELGSAPRPGTLQAWLARILDDPGVRVLYPHEASGGWIDHAGRPVPLRDELGQETIRILRAGTPVAVVVRQRGGAGGDELRERLGPAACLAIDNERLSAQLLAQLADVRASRARIVESADNVRWALERDLHDGAQQRLLAAMYELRLAEKGETARDGIGALAADAASAVTELRDLAHGIFPAIVNQTGLEPALQSLADCSPVPVEIAVFGEPTTAPARHVAYLLVAAAIPDHPGAPAMAVRVTPTSVDIEGAADVDYSSLADRVGALDGRLSVDGTRVRAELPCG